jgi:hypothetical protein
MPAICTQIRARVVRVCVQCSPLLFKVTHSVLHRFVLLRACGMRRSLGMHACIHTCASTQHKPGMTYQPQVQQTMNTGRRYAPRLPSTFISMSLQGFRNYRSSNKAQVGKSASVIAMAGAVHYLTCMCWAQDTQNQGKPAVINTSQYKGTGSIERQKRK